MEKRSKDKTTNEYIEKSDFKDSAWAIIVMLVLFGWKDSPFGSEDKNIETRVSKLEGKVDTIERLIK